MVFAADAVAVTFPDEAVRTHAPAVILLFVANTVGFLTPDGTCIRDYIHVTDLAQAHILAVKYLKNGNESNIFNLGNGVGYSVKEVIDKARKVTGHPIPAIETPKRAGDPARLVASSEKARKILGWNPVHDSLEEIISDAWNWHKNHPDGF